MFAYALIEILRRLNIGLILNIVNSHWPGLIIAIMCLLLGINGLQRKQINGNTA
jgi:hypothetical protein